MRASAASAPAVLPSAIGTPADTRALWLLAGITLLGGALRLFHLGAQPLWTDEAFSWRWAHLTLGELWGSHAILETNPPLYYTLQKLLLPLGESEGALRLLAAIFGTLTVPLVFLLGRLVGGTVAGLVAAALLATSPIHIAYSQEARGYTLLMAGATLAVWGMLRFFQDAAPAHRRDEPAGSSIALGAYAAGTTIALYCHNTAVFLWLFANLAAVLWWLGETGRSRRFALLWVAANLVPLALYLFWVPVVVIQALYDPGTSIGWMVQPGPREALMWVARIYGQRYFPVLQPYGAAFLTWPVFLLLAGWAWWRWPERRPLVAVLLLFVAGVPLLTWGTGLVLRPLLQERTLLWPLGLWLVLVAVGIALIRSPARRGLALAAVLLVQLSGLAFYYGTDRKLPWDEVVAVIARDHLPDDGFVVTPLPGHWTFGYYASRVGLPHRDHVVWVAKPPVPEYPNIDVSDRGTDFMPPAGLGALRERYARLWVAIEKGRRQDPERQIEAMLRRIGRIVRQRTYTDDLELMLVELAPMPPPALTPGG